MKLNLRRISNSKIIANALIVCVCFLFISGKSTNDQSFIEIYITPRICVIGGFSGCSTSYLYSLDKQSIKVPYQLKSYETFVVKDSVYEVYYTKIFMTDTVIKSFITNLIKDDTLHFFHKRIAVVLKTGKKSKTYFMDGNFTTKEKTGKKLYKIGEPFKQFLLSKMPAELLEGWIQ